MVYHRPASAIIKPGMPIPSPVPSAILSLTSSPPPLVELAPVVELGAVEDIILAVPLGVADVAEVEALTELRIQMELSRALSRGKMMTCSSNQLRQEPSSLYKLTGLS